MWQALHHCCILAFKVSSIKYEYVTVSLSFKLTKHLCSTSESNHEIWIIEWILWWKMAWWLEPSRFWFSMSRPNFMLFKTEFRGSSTPLKCWWEMVHVYNHVKVYSPAISCAYKINHGFATFSSTYKESKLAVQLNLKFKKQNPNIYDI